MSPTNTTTKTPEQLAAEQAEAARLQAQQEQEKRDRDAAAEAKKADSQANKATEKAAKLREEAEKALREAEEAERVAAELNGKADTLAAEAPADVVELTFVTASVRRDEQTDVPVQIFEHELPILRRLHGGEDNVRVISARKRKVANFDAMTEFERLKRKYKVAGSNPTGADVVNDVYRSAEDVAKAAGVSIGRGTPRRPPQSLQKTANEDKVIGARA